MPEMDIKGRNLPTAAASTENRMQWLGARSFEFALFSVLCLSAGCASRGSTRLCANFKSYQSLEDVRAELGRRGLTSGWTEQAQGTAATDRRPAYKMVSLSGPYKLAGIEGRLRFTFYNGQLMETEFSPQKKAEDCLTILRKEMPEMPQKPSKEIVMDRRTRFRFDIAPNGDISLTWYDPQIEKQWMKWVAKNA
jgi:hypothetical protein